jgi:hypothetical protein
LDLVTVSASCREVYQTPGTERK